MRVSVCFEGGPFSLAVLDDRISFDGILSYFAYKVYREKVSENEAIKLATENLPLKKHFFQKDSQEVDFFYSASRPYIESSSELRSSLVFVNLITEPFIYQKFIDFEFVKKLFSARKFAEGFRGSGPYKKAVVSFNCIPFRRIKYVVDVEDERFSEFQDLVNKINKIGKFTRLGFGQVQRCVIQSAEGELIERFVPVESGVDVGKVFVQMSYKPPYWKKEAVLCGLARL